VYSCALKIVPCRDAWDSKPNALIDAYTRAHITPPLANRPPRQPSVRWQHFLSLLPKPGTVYPQTSRLLSVQRTLSNVASRPGFSKGPATNIETTIITIILSMFLLLSLSSSLGLSLSLSSLLSSPFDVMRHPSVFTRIVAGAVEMTVLPTITILWVNAHGN